MVLKATTTVSRSVRSSRRDDNRSKGSKDSSGKKKKNSENRGDHRSSSSSNQKKHVSDDHRNNKKEGYPATKDEKNRVKEQQRQQQQRSTTTSKSKSKKQFEEIDGRDDENCNARRGEDQNGGKRCDESHSSSIGSMTFLSNELRDVLGSDEDDSFHHHQTNKGMMKKKHAKASTSKRLDEMLEELSFDDFDDDLSSFCNSAASSTTNTTPRRSDQHNGISIYDDDHAVLNWSSRQEKSNTTTSNHTNNSSSGVWSSKMVPNNSSRSSTSGAKSSISRLIDRFIGNINTSSPSGSPSGETSGSHEQRSTTTEDDNEVPYSPIYFFGSNAVSSSSSSSNFGFGGTCDDGNLDLVFPIDEEFPIGEDQPTPMSAANCCSSVFEPPGTDLLAVTKKKRDNLRKESSVTKTATTTDQEKTTTKRGGSPQFIVTKPYDYRSLIPPELHDQATALFLEETDESLQDKLRQGPISNLMANLDAVLSQDSESLKIDSVLSREVSTKGEISTTPKNNAAAQLAGSSSSLASDKYRSVIETPKKEKMMKSPSSRKSVSVKKGFSFSSVESPSMVKKKHSLVADSTAAAKEKDNAAILSSESPTKAVQKKITPPMDPSSNKQDKTVAEPSKIEVKKKSPAHHSLAKKKDSGVAAEKTPKAEKKKKKTPADTSVAKKDKKALPDTSAAPVPQSIQIKTKTSSPKEEMSPKKKKHPISAKKQLTNPSTPVISPREGKVKHSDSNISRAQEGSSNAKINGSPSPKGERDETALPNIAAGKDHPQRASSDDDSSASMASEMEDSNHAHILPWWDSASNKSLSSQPSVDNLFSSQDGGSQVLPVWWDTDDKLKSSENRRLDVTKSDGESTIQTSDSSEPNPSARITCRITNRSIKVTNDGTTARCEKRKDEAKTDEPPSTVDAEVTGGHKQTGEGSTEPPKDPTPKASNAAAKKGDTSSAKDTLATNATKKNLLLKERRSPKGNTADSSKKLKSTRTSNNAAKNAVTASATTKNQLPIKNPSPKSKSNESSKKLKNPNSGNSKKHQSPAKSNSKQKVSEKRTTKTNYSGDDGILLELSDPMAKEGEKIPPKPKEDENVSEFFSDLLSVLDGTSSAVQESSQQVEETTTSVNKKVLASPTTESSCDRLDFSSAEKGENLEGELGTESTETVQSSTSEMPPEKLPSFWQHGGGSSGSSSSSSRDPFGTLELMKLKSEEMKIETCEIQNNKLVRSKDEKIALDYTEPTTSLSHAIETDSDHVIKEASNEPLQAEAHNISDAGCTMESKTSSQSATEPPTDEALANKVAAAKALAIKIASAKVEIVEHTRTTDVAFSHGEDRDTFDIPQEWENQSALEALLNKIMEEVEVDDSEHEVKKQFTAEARVQYSPRNEPSLIDCEDLETIQEESPSTEGADESNEVETPLNTHSQFQCSSQIEPINDSKEKLETRKEESPSNEGVDESCDVKSTNAEEVDDKSIRVEASLTVHTQVECPQRDALPSDNKDLKPVIEETSIAKEINEHSQVGKSSDAGDKEAVEKKMEPLEVEVGSLPIIDSQPNNSAPQSSMKGNIAAEECLDTLISICLRCITPHALDFPRDRLLESPTKVSHVPPVLSITSPEGSPSVSEKSHAGNFTDGGPDPDPLQETEKFIDALQDEDKSIPQEEATSSAVVVGEATSAVVVSSSLFDFSLSSSSSASAFSLNKNDASSGANIDEKIDNQRPHLSKESKKSSYTDYGHSEDALISDPTKDTIVTVEQSESGQTIEAIFEVNDGSFEQQNKEASSCDSEAIFEENDDSFEQQNKEASSCDSEAIFEENDDSFEQQNKEASSCDSDIDSIPSATSMEMVQKILASPQEVRAHLSRDSSGSNSSYEKSSVDDLCVAWEAVHPTGSPLSRMNSKKQNEKTIQPEEPKNEKAIPSSGPKKEDVAPSSKVSHEKKPEASTEPTQLLFDDFDINKYLDYLSPTNKKVTVSAPVDASSGDENKKKDKQVTPKDTLHGFDDTEVPKGALQADVSKKALETDNLQEDNTLEVNTIQKKMNLTVNTDDDNFDTDEINKYLEYLSPTKQTEGEDGQSKIPFQDSIESTNSKDADSNQSMSNDMNSNNENDEEQACHESLDSSISATRTNASIELAETNQISLNDPPSHYSNGAQNRKEAPVGPESQETVSSASETTVSVEFAETDHISWSERTSHDSSDFDKDKHHADPESLEKISLSTVLSDEITETEHMKDRISQHSSGIEIQMGSRNEENMSPKTLGSSETDDNLAATEEFEPACSDSPEKNESPASEDPHEKSEECGSKHRRNDAASDDGECKCPEDPIAPLWSTPTLSMPWDESADMMMERRKSNSITDVEIRSQSSHRESKSLEIPNAFEHFQSTSHNPIKRDEERGKSMDPCSTSDICSKGQISSSSSKVDDLSAIKRPVRPSKSIEIPDVFEYFQRTTSPIAADINEHRDEETNDMNKAAAASPTETDIDEHHDEATIDTNEASAASAASAASTAAADEREDDEVRLEEEMPMPITSNPQLTSDHIRESDSNAVSSPSSLESNSVQIEKSMSSQLEEPTNHQSTNTDSGSDTGNGSTCDVDIDNEDDDESTDSDFSFLWDSYSASESDRDDIENVPLPGTEVSFHSKSNTCSKLGGDSSSSGGGGDDDESSNFSSFWGTSASILRRGNSSSRSNRSTFMMPRAYTNSGFYGSENHLWYLYTQT